MNKKLLSPSRFVPIFFILVGLIFITFSGINGFKISRQFTQHPRLLHRQTDVTSIQSWMTLGYISRTYGVPEPEIERRFKIEPKKYHHSSISQIAKILKKSDADFLQEIQTFIANFQSQHTEPAKVP